MSELMLPDPIFVDEALANLDAMEQLLTTLSTDSAATDRVDTIFRCAHSVKGGAAAFGLTDVAYLMHQSESLLDQWRKKRLAPDAGGAGLLRECVRLARNGLTGMPVQTSEIQWMSAQFLHLVDVPTSIHGQRLLCIALTGPLGDDAVAAILAMFHDIRGLGTVLSRSGDGDTNWQMSVHCAVSDAELMDLLAMHVERERITIRPMDSLPADRKPPVSPMPVASAAAAVRVTQAQWALLDRLSDELCTLAGDMAVRACGGDESHRLARLRGLATQLHKAMQGLRSAPAGTLFALVPPLLASLSSPLGKSFSLSLSGESLQLDRRLIQALADPLMHLVRNACDHGIELPEHRRLSGKPTEGHITLSAALCERRLMVEVRDDGQGFSRDKLLKEARARGMDVPDDAPDQALWPLVFMPGFSTASTVTLVSGRGVGMDVVRRKVTALGGTVDIESASGAGTCITIRLTVSAPPGAPVSAQG